MIPSAWNRDPGVEIMRRIGIFSGYQAIVILAIGIIVLLLPMFSNPTDGSNPDDLVAEVTLWEIGHTANDGFQMDLEIQDDLAFVAQREDGLAIVNISDPEDPQVVGNYDTVGDALGVAVQGKFCFIAVKDDGLLILNITDPSSPFLEGTYDPISRAIDVVVSGETAYVLDQYKGLYVIDISNVSDPEKIGDWNIGECEEGILRNDQLFVVGGNGGLRIIDVSNRSDPKMAGSIDLEGTSTGVSVIGDHAYVSDYLNGLHVVDISDVTDPVLLYTMDVDRGAEDVFAWDSFCLLLCTGYYSALYIIDISNVEEPKIIGMYDSPTMSAVWYDGRIISISNGMRFCVYETGPVAWIDDLQPEAALRIDEVTGIGRGTGMHGIERYAWRSNLTGELSNGSSPVLPPTAVQNATQTISFKVMDSQGSWSQEVSKEVLLNHKPTCEIVSISPNPAFVGDTITLSGSKQDDHGFSTFVWRSSIDGVISNVSWWMDIETTQLSPGNHTISLRVMDNHGVWSVEATETLMIYQDVLESHGLWVEIISPIDDSEMDGLVNFSGVAHDNAGSIEFIRIYFDPYSSIDVEHITYLGNGTYSWYQTWDSSRRNTFEYWITVKAYNGEVYSEEVVLNLRREVPSESESRSVPLDEAVIVVGGILIFIMIIGGILYYNVYIWPKKKHQLIRKHGWARFLHENGSDIWYVLKRPRLWIAFLFLLYIVGDGLRNGSAQGIFIASCSVVAAAFIVSFIFFRQVRFKVFSFLPNVIKGKFELDHNKQTISLNRSSRFGSKTPPPPDRPPAFIPPSLPGSTYGRPPSPPPPSPGGSKSGVNYPLRSPGRTTTFEDLCHEHDLFESQEIANIEVALGDQLSYVQRLGFLTTWNMEVLKHYLVTTIDQLPNDEYDHSVIEACIVRMEGLSLDWKYSSEDVLLFANDRMKDEGIEVLPANPGKLDEIVDRTKGSRRVEFTFNGEEQSIIIVTPGEILGAINELQGSKGSQTIFLDWDTKGDSYGNIVTTRTNYRKMQLDGNLTFHEP